MEIKITGTTGEGKTAVALLIEKTLKEHGIKAKAVNEDSDQERDFMDANMDKCLSAMGERGVFVEIETVHVALSSEKKYCAIQVQFVNIDSWNRPVFKDVDKKAYYGSTEHLFPYGETEAEVLKTVTAEDLTYFGSAFDCEPMGTSCEVEIIRS